MFFKDFLNTLYQLLDKDIYISEAEENIRVGITGNYRLTTEDQEFILNNKKTLLLLLAKNKLFSPITKRLVLKTELLSSPLTSRQKIFLMSDLTLGQETSCNIPVIYNFKKSNLNILKLLAALEKLVLCSDIFKMKLQLYGNDYYQTIDRKLSFNTIIESYKLDSGANVVSKLQQLINYRLDIINGPSAKIILIEQQGSDVFYLFLLFHHIFVDGWTINIIVNKLDRILDGIVKNQSNDEDTKIMSLNQIDFYYKEKAFKMSNKYQNIKNYWRQKLEFANFCSLPADRLEVNNSQTINSKNQKFTLNNLLTEKTRNLAKKWNISLFTLFLAIFSYLLKVMSNQDDFIITSPVSGRADFELYDANGCFINMVFLVVRFSKVNSFAEFIKYLENEVDQTFLHQEIQYEDLLKNLKAHQTYGVNKPTVMFSIRSFDYLDKDNQYFNLQNEYSSIEEIYSPERFDLSLFINEYKDSIEGYFNYSSKKFNNDTIKTYVQYFFQILEYLLSDQSLDNKKIFNNEISYLESNNFVVNVDYNKNLLSTLNSNASNYKTKIFLSQNGTDIDYRSFDLVTDKIAAYLHNISIVAGEIIIVCFDNDINFLQAIFAIFKVGAAYLPISKNMPVERIKIVIQQSKARFIITNSLVESQLKKIAVENFLSKVQVINIQDPLNFNSLENKKYNIFRNNNIKNNNLAYVLYTSGTSGTPKGVRVEHTNIENYLEGANKILGCDQNEIHMTTSSFCFDLGYTSLFLSLHTAAKIVLVNEEEISSPKSINNIIISNKVTTIKTTPSYLKVFINYLDTNNLKFPNSVKKLIIGGENLTIDILNYFSAYHNSGLRIFNHYGPTECTIGICIYEVDYNQQSIKKQFSLRPLLGAPIKGVKAYVLNSKLEFQPKLAKGELYVAGKSITNSYINSISSQNNYLINPYSKSNEDKILYKTGDIVRVNLQNELEIFGREDSQVKINGYRVDLSEINNAILQHGDILNCEVLKIIDENSNIKLVAIIVASIFKPKIIEIKEFISRYISSYMIPHEFIFVDKIPINNNGKVDYQALITNIPRSNHLFTPLKTAKELLFASIFSNVLSINIESIGQESDFFNLGGDSIKAIKITTRINKIFCADLKVSDIHNYRKFKAILCRINDSANSSLVAVALNNSDSKKNLFMVHPGGAGCEGYLTIAKQLEEKYLCIGLDSYNLNKAEKIYSLDKLANLYVNEIIEYEKENFNILGWSLGGNIAIKIASILESRNKNANINLYLLDVIIPDEMIFKYSPKEEFEEALRILKNSLYQDGYDETYILNLINSLEIDRSLFFESQYIKLLYSKIYLFKALIKDNLLKPTINQLDKCKYQIELKYNNFERIMADVSKIDLSLIDSSHSNIVHYSKNKLFEKLYYTNIR